jgi:ArsR family transcriptional regulator
MGVVADTRSLSRLFGALEDETRLSILGVLAHGELCVCHLQVLLALSQPNVSRHLRILRLAGIVSDRRSGRWVHNRLTRQVDPDCARVLRPLIRAFATDDALRRRIRSLVAKAGPEACAS